MAQQAYRKRQSSRILELEQRLQSRTRTTDEQILSLERENSLLKQQLATTLCRLESVQITLALATKDITHGLRSPARLADELDGMSVHPQATQDLQSSPTLQDVESATETQPNHPVQSNHVSHTSTLIACQTGRQITTDESVVPDPSHLASIDTTLPLFCTGFEGGELSSDDFIDWSGQAAEDMNRWSGIEPQFDLSSPRHLPGVWSYQYQMGPSAYRTRLTSLIGVRKSLCGSNSAWSDHVWLFQHCLLTKVGRRIGGHIQANVADV